ncbi:GGDEF domain-containing protein [Deinococcus koreensis]|uniref:GGDEF domain-containing protein n=1 Tax=Deinococcus koreensis TaxID=2054903 RepID=A0A2K3UXK8_9DEIO|nr:GGDEF domain-containing protein [Deinococcus koreensis]PNY81268.1 GGDEF domain-containing protein [Deinococcus koreensis]
MPAPLPPPPARRWNWRLPPPSAEPEQWNALGRRAFVWLSPLGVLACAAGIGVQWPGVNPLDLWGLSALALTIALSASLLQLRRLPAHRALGAVYTVAALYFLATLANELRTNVGPDQRLTEATYWFPVMFATAFLAWEVRQAFSIVALTYAVMLLITVLAVPQLQAAGDWSVRLFAILLQFLLAQGVTVALLGSLAYVKQRLAQVRTLAYMDVLTGLPNRRYAEEHWPALRRGVRTVVLFDIDHFKQVNDQHGHHVGDEVLRGVAALVRELSGNNYLLARWGGEEFLLILPGQPPERAAALVEFLRASVASQRFGPVERVTASFGLTHGEHTHSLHDCVQRADAAMYRAKQSGRNRVMHDVQASSGSFVN